MKDGVFTRGLASLSQSLQHTTIHYLSTGQGKLSWGTYCVLDGVLTACVSVFVGALLCMQEVSMCPGQESWIPEEGPGSMGPVLPSGPYWAAGEARRGDSSIGGGGGGGGMEANEQRRCRASSCPLTDRIWSMSCCRGSRPSLRTQTYLQCICQAACAVTLSPLQNSSVFLLGVRGGWWEDRGRKGKGWGRFRGERGAWGGEG